MEAHAQGGQVVEHGGGGWRQDACHAKTDQRLIDRISLFRIVIVEKRLHERIAAGAQKRFDRIQSGLSGEVEPDQMRERLAPRRPFGKMGVKPVLEKEADDVG